MVVNAVLTIYFKNHTYSYSQAPRSAQIEEQSNLFICSRVIKLLLVFISVLLLGYIIHCCFIMKADNLYCLFQPKPCRLWKEGKRTSKPIQRSSSLKYKRWGRTVPAQLSSAEPWEKETTNHCIKCNFVDISKCSNLSVSMLSQLM